jgi:hypothetical protein
MWGRRAGCGDKDADGIAVVSVDSFKTVVDGFEVVARGVTHPRGHKADAGRG